MIKVMDKEVDSPLNSYLYVHWILDFKQLLLLLLLMFFCTINSPVLYTGNNKNNTMLEMERLTW